MRCELINVAFGVVEASDGFLLGYVPDDQQVICAGAGEHLWVVRTPRDGCNGLLVLGHDGAQLELIVSVVQLRRINTIYNVYV